MTNAKKRWTRRLASHVLLTTASRERQTRALTTKHGKENFNGVLVKVSVPKHKLQWAMSLSKRNIYIHLDRKLKFVSADCDLSDEQLMNRALEAL